MDLGKGGRVMMTRRVLFGAVLLSIVSPCATNIPVGNNAHSSPWTLTLRGGNCVLDNQGAHCMQQSAMFTRPQTPYTKLSTMSDLEKTWGRDPLSANRIFHAPMISQSIMGDQNRHSISTHSEIRKPSSNDLPKPTESQKHDMTRAEISWCTDSSPSEDRHSGGRCEKLGDSNLLPTGSHKLPRPSHFVNLPSEDHRSSERCDKYDGLNHLPAANYKLPRPSPAVDVAPPVAQEHETQMDNAESVHRCGRCGCGIDGKQWYMAGNEKHCSIECSTSTALGLEEADPALREGTSAVDLVATTYEE